MPYAVNQNGVQWCWHDPSEDYQLKDGETFSDEVPTPTQDQIDAFNETQSIAPDVLGNIADWVATQANPPQAVVDFVANKIAKKSKVSTS